MTREIPLTQGKVALVDEASVQEEVRAIREDYMAIIRGLLTMFEHTLEDLAAKLKEAAS